jgi:hypothetical protein
MKPTVYNRYANMPEPSINQNGLKKGDAILPLLSIMITLTEAKLGQKNWYDNYKYTQI